MENFVKVANVSEIKEGQIKVVITGKEKVILFLKGGKFSAVSSICTHRGGPLDKGPLNGEIVTCPWHGSEFDLISGKVVKGPATASLKQFKVKVEKDDVFISV
jgi:nitrite reductase/ring-hydroxylating ferredoxin subunit